MAIQSYAPFDPVAGSAYFAPKNLIALAGNDSTID